MFVSSNASHYLVLRDQMQCGGYVIAFNLVPCSSNKVHKQHVHGNWFPHVVR